MGTPWTIHRDTLPLSGLEVLAKATGGASREWDFREPSVGEVQAAADKDGTASGDTVGKIVETCVVDTDGEQVFGAGQGFRDLPTGAAKELSRFVLDHIAPEEEADGDAGKSAGSASTS